MRDDSQKPSIKPWWLHNLENPDAPKLLKDLNEAHASLVEHDKDFRDLCLQHVALYQGMAIDKEITKKGRTFRDSEGAAGSTRFKHLIVNHLRDVTDSAVSRLSTFKPGVTVLPNHGVEFQDKAKAKVVKSWLDSYTYTNNIDDIRRKVQRDAFIFGEAYLLVEWDPSLGDIHPAARRLKKTVMIETDEGEVKVTKVKRTGDVGLRPLVPFRVFPEPHPSNRYEQSSWVMIEEVMYLEELKAKYPKAASKIKPSGPDGENPDLYNYGITKESDKVTMVTLFHKATEEVPEGRIIRFTEHAIIENEELPYSHGELPILRLSSIDVPGTMRGMSPFKDLKALQSAINTLYSIMLRDRSLASPKLFVPAGSVDVNQQASNKPGVIQYKGGVPPTWSVPNMVSGDIMGMIDKLENTFQKLSNSSGTRSGEGIPNVEAFKAFGFFEEQATRRESTSIAKHRDFLQQIFKFVALTAADFYTQSDERLIKMVGKHNQYLLKHFNVDDLKHSYDIRVQNTSALPESKAARVQTVIQLSQAFPELFTQEKIADMLDLSSPDAFFDLTAAAINAAEAENEDMMDGKEVAEPQNFEDHLQHWEAHVKQFNNPQVKATLPRDPAAANAALQMVLSGEGEAVSNSPALIMAKHLNTTEGLMFQKALNNPKFAQRLADFENYPVFFNLPMSISEVLMSHSAPMQPIPPETGVDQEIALPVAQAPNPNKLV